MEPNQSESKVDQIPKLDRATIVSREHIFCCDDIAKEEVKRFSTSGTTGAPLNIYWSREKFLHEWVYLVRLLCGLHGLPPAGAGPNTDETKAGRTPDVLKATVASQYGDGKTIGVGRDGGENVELGLREMTGRGRFRAWGKSCSPRVESAPHAHSRDFRLCRSGGEEDYPSFS